MFKKGILLLLLFMPILVHADDLGYTIDKYDINIIVNENNTFDITEKITANFKEPRHGIYRTIPLSNTVKRTDGTTTNNRAQVNKVKVNENYSTTWENNNYKIKIGSASRTITGLKEYVIKYRYNLGKDPLKDKDEFYLNLIGTDWNTSISNITFKITMPKEFDQTKLGFASGAEGSTNNNITYNIDGNTITGNYNGTLNSHEAITTRLELPDNYFTNAALQFDIYEILIISISLIGLIISFYMWKKYGDDEQLIETVEFYPPENINSLNAGSLYKGSANSKDVTSLLIYLANKGYIKIEETQEKSLFGKTNSYKIIKLKKYDGTDKNERSFMSGLFRKSKRDSEGTEYVTKEELYNDFYTTMERILNDVNSKQNKALIYEYDTVKKQLFLAIINYIIAFIIHFLPLYQYMDIVGALTIALICSLIIYASLYITILLRKIILKIIAGIATALFLSIYASLIYEFTLGNTIGLISYLISFILLVGMSVFNKYQLKRTKYSHSMLEKLKGFKNYLETAEKDSLEAQVTKNPNYFYDILPYTYVLGVSDKWIKKFESISLKEPDWYNSSNEFNVIHFGNFMNNTMSSAESTMTTSPDTSYGGFSSGGSGGFSGGGFSGGGSGGGGGGSW